MVGVMSREVDTVIDNRMLLAVGRISGPILLAIAGPAFFWVSASISDFQVKIGDLQRTVAVLSDRLSQNTPAYRPSDALRDQSIMDQRFIAFGERIARVENKVDAIGKGTGDGR